MAIAAHGDARGNAAILLFAKGMLACWHKHASLKAILVNDLIAAPGAEEPLARRIERHAVEGFRHGRAAEDAAGREVEHDQLMLAVAAVEHDGVGPSGVHRDVDREVAHGQLPTHGPQRPLRGQHHRAVWLGAGNTSLIC